MRLTEYKISKLSLLKYAFAALSMAGMVACGAGLKFNDGNDGGPTTHNNFDPNDDDEEDEDLNEALELPAGSQLFSLKSEGDDSSFTQGLAANAINSSGTGSERLYIINPQGKAKEFLKSKKPERLHLIKNGKETEYLVRFEQKYGKHGRPLPQWYIFNTTDKKNGVPVQRKENGWSGAEFAGQTATKGYLAFKDGNFVNLQGKREALPKSLKNVSQIIYVSDDTLALERRIDDKSYTTLINLNSGLRKGYGSYFHPNFVQIKDDGDGLLSDYNKGYKENYSQISSLKAEIESKGKDREAVYTKAQTNDVHSFYGSIKIPNMQAALLIAYVSVSGGSDWGNKLVWVEPKNAGWEFTVLSKFPDSEAHSSSYNKPFIQGNGYTIVRSGTDFLLVTHATKTVKKFETEFELLFDIRASDDLTKFVAVGEMNNGDQFMSNYDAAGTFVSKVEIQVE